MASSNLVTVVVVKHPLNWSTLWRVFHDYSEEIIYGSYSRDMLRSPVENKIEPTELDLVSFWMFVREERSFLCLLRSRNREMSEG